MTADEAKDYGLVDEVVKSRKETKEITEVIKAATEIK